MRNLIVSLMRMLYLSVTILLCTLFDLYAQENATITGKLVNKTDKESVPYANVLLFKVSDSKLIDGLISDTSGCFVFSGIHEGNYNLKISLLGYEPLTMEINLPRNTHYEVGTLFMNQSAIILGETVVTAERLRGRSEKDKTAYFITKKMSESSNNGLDIIKLIPGVQVDLMRNISLDGSQRVLVLVDGNERDKNFVSQIIPDHIEKVETQSAPPAGYDGDVTGVINIVLKKEKKSGISGQINLEIPVLSSLYYLHPDYSLNFVYKKLNFFTSYNGELINFDQQESNLRRIKIEDAYFETRSDQYVVQKFWSHNFHYGLDYSFNPKTRLSFYGFYNPYSQEYDGRARATTEMNSNGKWEALRNTSDMNRGIFYSLYLKHTFNEKGGEFTLETSNYQLTGENIATYYTISDGSTEFKNSSKPVQKSLNMKADISIPFGHNLVLSSGARIRTYHMEDRTFDEFRYSGEVYATYVTLGQTLSAFDWKLGLRVEEAVSDLKQVFSKHYLSLLPSASLSYKISPDKMLKLAVSNSVNRPNIYQLNPNLSIDDPYSIRRGKAFLDPEIRTAVSLEYTRKFKSNFGSVRLFYNRTGKAISSLIFLNDTSVFESLICNLGTLYQSGFQLSGTFKVGSIVTFIPYLRLYAQLTDVNKLAEVYSISDRNQIVVEPGFSSLISFRHDINVGMTFQYGSPRNNISGTSFSDPLYMISLEKTFKKRIKAGIVNVLPFTKMFTYQGAEINTQNLYGRYAGDINLSRVLLWFKLSYQFNSGKKHEAIKHGLEDIDAVPKKGGL